ncbi:unnamed protein product [Blepharisma stoltei]|uniref:Dickkopf N-terminal cysteine-rich domain-containing protein n=1 Tax=Blepharisma stoltei TaxID=1481888 RepID=A0AAU9KBG8_9CILI|nr:unnamed protein product [Blepharisma stoltei]
MFLQTIQVLALASVILITIGQNVVNQKLHPYGSFSNIFSEEIEDAMTCNKFTCKMPDQNFAGNTCGYFVSANNTVYSQPCEDESLLCFSPNVSQNYTCVINDPFPIALPGDKCSKASDCYLLYSKSCTGGICIGLDLKDSCTSTFQCDPDSSCRKINGAWQCAALIEAGKTGCLNEYDCEYSAGCSIVSLNDTSKNTCIKYGSLTPGTKITNYTCNTNSNVCSSGLCGEDNNGNFVCTDEIISSGQTPLSCPEAYSSTGCISKEDIYLGHGLNGSCLCAYNPNGDTYCSLQKGDAPYVALRNEYSKWQSSSAIKNCNTNWRYPALANSKLQCAADYYDSKDYSAFLYRLLYVSYYVNIYGSEECVLKTLYPFYLQAKDNFNNGGNGNNTDSSISIALTAFIAVLAI